MDIGTLIIIIAFFTFEVREQLAMNIKVNVTNVLKIQLP